METCLAELEERKDEDCRATQPDPLPAGSESREPASLTKESPRVEGKRSWQRTRTCGFYSARCLRLALSVCLTFTLWLFMAAFLLQFAHTHNEGKSLSERVETMTNYVQVPFEKVLGFDMRYEFPTTTVDFMPLIIFVVFLVLRNRADALLLKGESALKGTHRPKAVVYRSADLDLLGSASKVSPAKVNPSVRNEGPAARSAQILSIYAD